MYTIEEFINLEAHDNAILKPVMDYELYKTIKEDIRQYGLQNDILIDNHKILDGVQRQRMIRELHTEKRLPAHFKLKIREHNPTDPDYTPANAVVSLNVLRNDYSKFQRAMIGVKEFYEMVSTESAKRMKDNQHVNQDEKGTTAEIIAQKVGSNNNYVSICIALWEYSTELYNVVLRGQLNYRTGREFNKLTLNKKKQYLEWFMNHQGENYQFEHAQDHFREDKEDKKQAEKQRGDQGQCTDSFQADDESEEYPVFAVFNQTLCPAFIDEITELANKYHYISGKNNIWAVSDNKVMQVTLASLKEGVAPAIYPMPSVSKASRKASIRWQQNYHEDQKAA